MKISIGLKSKNKAWGGGNQFVKNLSNYLIKNNHKVTYNLNSEDIDLILLIDPRPESESASFNHFDIQNYLKKKPDTIIVHRINECDERKKTNHVNHFIKQASKVSDFRIFISKWLQTIHSINKNNEKVILNGADTKIFKNYKNKIKNKKINIVTHHWSAHEMKGMKYYIFLDQLLKTNSFNKNFSFSYIGNLAKDHKFRFSKIYKPKHGIELAKNISKHNVYITASQNEPGGNHHVEALNCGLPILYIKSGPMQEYCKNYGYGFKNEIELKQCLFKIKKNYKYFYKKTKSYKLNSQFTNKNYLKTFEILIKNKNKIINKRSKNLNFFDKMNFNIYLILFKIKFIIKKLFY